MPPSADAPTPDIFTAARAMFHQLRGQLTVLVNAVDLVRADQSHPLSANQEAELTRILATVDAFARTLTTHHVPLLEALVLSPASARISQVAVRRGATIQRSVLAHHLDAMRAAQAGQRLTSVLVVAGADLLPGLRRAFRAAHCQVYMTTQLTDVPYLLDAHRADLIALAPPAAETASWWRTLRMLLPQHHENVPLLHLAEVPSPADRKDAEAR